MPDYICNKHADDKGRHEVHATTCSYLPIEKNRIDIGYHYDCNAAIQHLKSKYSNGNFYFDGCYYCSPSCHKG